MPPASKRGPTTPETAPMARAIFFVVHATLSVFTQTFFLHRYGASEDPRSPPNYSGLGSMMMDTKNRYHDLACGLGSPEPRFDGGYPEWKTIDRLGQSRAKRAVRGSLYLGVHVVFATRWCRATG